MSKKTENNRVNRLDRILAGIDLEVVALQINISKKSRMIDLLGFWIAGLLIFGISSGIYLYAKVVHIL